MCLSWNAVNEAFDSESCRHAQKHIFTHHSHTSHAVHRMPQCSSTAVLNGKENSIGAALLADAASRRRIKAD